MGIFTYTARDTQGQLLTGELEGQNAKAIKIQLADQGLFPVGVTAKGGAWEWDLSSFLRNSRKNRIRTMVSFTRQFAALFKAGVSIDKIFSALIKQAQVPDLRITLEKIRRDVGSGTSLHQAFKKHPKYFDDLYINMLSVGEQGGLLGSVLTNLANLLDRDYRIVGRIKSATLYPKIVLFVFIVVVIIMLVFVIPRFSTFYAGYGAELPTPTKILIGVSDIVKGYWFYVILLVGGVLFALKRYGRSGPGRLFFDTWKFRYPVFGSLNLLVANARFGHLVGSMYNSGVPLVKALEIVAGAIGNKAYEEQVKKVRQDVEQGTSLAVAMEQHSFFTPMMIETASAGEQSGSLDEMMETTASFYDEEASNTLDQLGTLIEPLLMVGLFGLVALLAFAIFLPMWNVSSVILPH